MDYRLFQPMDGGGQGAGSAPGGPGGAPTPPETVSLATGNPASGNPVGGNPVGGSPPPASTVGGEPDPLRRQWETVDGLLQEKRYNEAARFLERLVAQARRLGAEELAAVQRRLAAVYYQQALSLKPLESHRRNALQAVRLLERAAELDPGQAAPLYWCGAIYRWFGMWPRALPYFQRALERDPHHAPSRLELGWAYVHTGAYDKARAQGSVAVEPGDPEAAGHWARLRSVLLLEDGQPLAALEAYPKAPPQDLPTEAWWAEFIHLAQVAGSGAPAPTLQLLEGLQDGLEMLLADGKPGGTPPGGREQLLSLMGKLAAAQGDTAKAEAYWNRLPAEAAARHGVHKDLLKITGAKAYAAFQQGDLDTAISLWQEACQGDPAEARYQENLRHALSAKGWREWEAGRIEEAVTAWREALGHGTPAPGLLRQLALGCEQLQRWEEANQHWQAYLHASQGGAGSPAAGQPPREQGAVLLAMAANALRAGRNEEGEKHLARGLERVAQEPALLTRAALLYLSAGNREQALAALAKALEADPRFEPAHKALVLTLQGQGAPAGTATALLRGILGRLDPDSWTYRYWRDQLMKEGRRAWEHGALDQAMDLFAALLLANSDDIPAWLWAGAVHMKKGNATGAEDCFSEAVRIDPGRCETYIDLGARFLAAGDRERAETYFGQAVEARPTPQTHVMIGELCAQAGVPDLAETHFRASLAGGKAAEPLLVQAICSLIQTGHENRVHPFLEQACREVPDSIQVQILLAVHHLREREWLAADERLRNAQRMAADRNAAALLDHVAFFRRALILLRTIGKVDGESLAARIRTLLEEWLAESGGAAETEMAVPVGSLEEALAEVPLPLPPAAPPEPSAIREPDTALGGESTAPDLGLFLKAVVPPATAA